MRTRQNITVFIILLLAIVIAGLNVYHLQKQLHKKTEAPTSVTHNINH